VTEQHASTPQGHTSSTGHAMATGDWLDLHFETNRPEYEAILRTVGFQPGSHVLDAGCGGGPFLPLLAAIVGAAGRIAALDLAPENVATVEARLADGDLPCPVEVQVGGLTALPYPDATFDGVWCANVSQYLSDEDLAAAVAEFRRVTRPGGLVAIKESESPVMYFGSRDPLLLHRFREAGLRASDGRVPGTWRGPGLRTWLNAAGLADVRVRTTVIERQHPLRPVERQFFVSGWRAFAATAASRDLSPEDQAEWAWHDAHAEEWVSRPDYYFREGNVLAVGRVPDAG
jgi:arsenite methyltransferase